MALSGPRDGGTFTNVADGAGDVAWSDPSNAGASDDAYAIAIAIECLVGSGKTQLLQATNFGFTIPTGSTIDGIVAEIERKSLLGTVQTSDFSILIMKGGTAQGTNHAVADVWPTTDAYKTYGSSSDKWGVTWTADDINATGFGIQIKAFNPNCDIDTDNAYVDHVRITVHYTEPVVTSKKTLSILGTG